MRRVRRVLLLLALAAAWTCGGSEQLPSPTLRLDLRDRLPKKPLRRLLAFDATYTCSRKVTLRVPRASQRFLLTWRVFDFSRTERYITALQVEPDGPTEGASGTKASAAVGDVTLAGGVMTVPVWISWSARAGCESVSVRRKLQLRSNDPGCKQPSSSIKIFSDSESVAPASGPAAAARDAGRGR